MAIDIHIWFRYFTVLILGCVGMIHAAPSTWAQVSRSIPSRNYMLARTLLYQGEYRNAEKVFQREVHSAIKTPQSRWIDSICYYAMLGETYYHQGRNAEALQEFNRACELSIAFPNWMLRVELHRITPKTHSVRSVAPWGQTKRPNVVYGHFPDSMSIQIGKLLTESDIQQGGVITPAQTWVIDVQEIVRCTALAIRRRNQLLGPIAKHDRLASALASLPPGGDVPANHWARAWVDLGFGIAQAGVDQLEMARQLLHRAILVGGQYDHPLTGVALLEQGRLAMQAGDLESASRLFEEASYAAYFYEDFGAIDEALVLGAQVHLASGGQGIYPPLDVATKWASRDRLRHIQAHLLLMKAENLALLGQPAAAEVVLKGDLPRILGRSEFRGSRLQGRFQYLSAWISYQLNRPKPAALALQEAILFGNRSGLWNFHISLMNRMFDNQSVNTRLANELYTQLLRDPIPTDWTFQPFESISFLTTPHHDAYDRWFAAALAEKKTEVALEISDRDKRHRFFSSLPLGGRLLAMRSILGTESDHLVGDSILQRQDLLTRYPRYDQLVLESREVERELRKLSLAPANSEAEQELLALMTRWDEIAKECEVFLRQMALGRHPADMIFPPMVGMAELQNRIKPGQVVIVFHESRNQIYGFALTATDYSVWEVGATRQLQKDIPDLLRVYGNHDANRAVPSSTLASDAWRETAAIVYQRLFESARLDLDPIRELIIVPDHILWYVPIEALVTKNDPTSQPILHRTPIRYAPTAGLAVGLHRPPRRILRTGIVSGRLFPRDASDVGETAAAELSATIPDSVVFPSQPVGPPRLNASLVDQLVVVADIENDPNRPIDWAPIPTPGRRGETLHDWMILPGGSPEFVILPGFHTLAESGLRAGPSKMIPGNEIFTALGSLFARGSRTVLLARWRTGGQTSIDLIREFTQELPHGSSAEAWQRSAILAMEMPVDPNREPRIDIGGSETHELKASHPFFWAGYLLADTGEVAQPENEQKKKN